MVTFLGALPGTSLSLFIFSCKSPSFSVTSADWGYALGLFGHYLSKAVDLKGTEDERQSTIMREIWELYGSSQANDAFDAVRTVAYENYDQSMHSIWMDFMSKNLFNSIEESEFHYFEDQRLIAPLEVDLETISEDVDLEMTLNNKSVKILGYNTLNKCLIELEHSSNDFIGNIVKLEGGESLTSIQNEIDFSIESSPSAELRIIMLLEKFLVIVCKIEFW